MNIHARPTIRSRRIARTARRRLITSLTLGLALVLSSVAPALVSYDAQAVAGEYEWRQLTGQSQGVKGDDLGWRSVSSSADGMKLVAIEDRYVPQTNADVGSLYTSVDAGATWVEQLDISAYYGWRKVIISADGTHIAAITDSTLYISSDGGATWTERSDQWLDISISADGAKIMAVTYRALHISLDAGATWVEQARLTHHDWYLATISADGTKMVAMTYDNLYTSTDAGATWTEQVDANVFNWREIAISADGTRLAARAGDGLYLSKDGGSTFAKLIIPDEPEWRGIAISNDGVHLGATAYNQTLYTSSDEGATWTEQVGARNRSLSSIAMSADGTRLVAAAEGGSVYTSLDAGVIWTEQTVVGVGNWTAIASSTDGRKIVAAADKSIYVSSDYGVTWEERFTVDETLGFTDIVSSADGMTLAAAAYGAIYISLDSGATWSKHPDTDAHDWISIAMSADGTKVAAVDTSDDGSPLGVSGAIYTSLDSGATWSKYPASDARTWTSIAMSADGAKIAASEIVLNMSTGGIAGSISISSDSGLSWTEQASDSGGAWALIDMSADGTRLFGIGVEFDMSTGTPEFSIYTSSDAGATWERRIVVEADMWDGGVLSADGSSLVIAGEIFNSSTQSYERVAYTSSDFGASWTKQMIATDTDAGRALAISADGSRVMMGQMPGFIYIGLREQPATPTPTPTPTVPIKTPSTPQSPQPVPTNTQPQTGGSVAYVPVEDVALNDEAVPPVPEDISQPSDKSNTATDDAPITRSNDENKPDTAGDEPAIPVAVQVVGGVVVISGLTLAGVAWRRGRQL